VRSTLALLLSFAICFGAALLGSMLTRPSLPVWYAGIDKPPWTPPNWIFGPVWSTLFAMMAVAAWLVWRVRDAAPALVRLALSLFALQLALNVGWSLCFFRLRQPGLAFVEILFLWLAILITVAAFGRVSRGAALLLVPYLAWVSFAAFLNFAIWRMNAS
jgi:benzodiazapine receptor